MIKNKLIIHAGLHRTGTKSIQYALSTNKHLLEKNNIFFIEPDYHELTQQGVKLFYTDIATNTPTSLVLLNLLKQSHEFEFYSNSLFVISYEDLPKAKYSSIKKFIDEIKDILNANIQIILYIRNLYKWLISILALNLTVKGILKTALDGFYVNPEIINNILIKLDCAVGSENFKIRLYREDADFNAAYDFLKNILQIPEENLSNFKFYPSKDYNKADLLLAPLIHYLSYIHNTDQKILTKIPDLIWGTNYQNQIIELLKPIVESINLDHPKISPFTFVLKQPPPLIPNQLHPLNKLKEFINNLN